MRSLIILLLLGAVVYFMMSCGSGSVNPAAVRSADSLSGTNKDSATRMSTATDTASGSPVTDPSLKPSERPTLLIYSFHVTNRCAGCIAIEEATRKTLEDYFKSEVAQKRIRLNVLNVDDEANKVIAEKYEAFGSGLYLTRVLKGKEITADLTGEGFKYAKNKQEKFIEILKNRITEFLK